MGILKIAKGFATMPSIFPTFLALGGLIVLCTSWGTTWTYAWIYVCIDFLQSHEYMDLCGSINLHTSARVRGFHYTLIGQLVTRIQNPLILSILSPRRPQSSSHICPHVVWNHKRESFYFSHSKSRISNYINI